MSITVCAAIPLEVNGKYRRPQDPPFEVDEKDTRIKDLMTRQILLRVPDIVAAAFAAQPAAAPAPAAQPAAAAPAPAAQPVKSVQAAPAVQPAGAGKPAAPARPAKLALKLPQTASKTTADQK